MTEAWQEWADDAILHSRGNTRDAVNWLAQHLVIEIGKELDRREEINELVEAAIRTKKFLKALKEHDDAANRSDSLADIALPAELRSELVCVIAINGCYDPAKALAEDAEFIKSCQ